MKKFAAISAAAALVPGLASAKSLIEFSQGIVKTVYTPLIGVIVGAALVVFLWGIVKYIYHSGDQKAAEEGSRLMSFGVIALLVMVTVWGLVRLGLAVFGFEGGQDASGSQVFGISTQGYQSSAQNNSLTGGYDYDYSQTYNYR